MLSTACVKVDSLDPLKAITKPFEAKKKKKDQRITNSPETNEEITVGSHSMKVVSKSMLKSTGAISAKSEKAKKFLSELASTSEVAENIPAQEISTEEPLLVGFPISLLGEQNVFGAVITKVSDKNNESLGILKLTDLTPIHVRTLIGRFEDGSPGLSLVGCVQNCSELSQQGSLVTIPIDSYDEKTGILYLDISALGQALDLITMLDPKGDYTKLTAVESVATEVNYDLSTLLFDVKTKMVKVGTPEAEYETAAKTEFTVRWYMKLSSTFNPAFESRSAAAGVGFFETDRAKSPKITRFSITENGKKIKYFIKNVPEKYRPPFKASLDNWNKKFKEVAGVEPLAYEFIEKSDPRHALLTPGDIRYNIIEWDEDNKAPYGGLGPSIANQYTGETMSANVLIQGPTIVEMYTKWFELSKDIRKLQRAGDLASAQRLERDFTAKAEQAIAKLSKNQFAVKLGEKLAFNVNAQRPELEDPMIKNHFELVPAGVSFDEYMTGYLTEMMEHELGHNLGLRHNFKGNLGASDSGQLGSASRSIMEYLGRPYRHLNVIGLYDEMAIRYGYTGETPKRLNWFCTDEHQATGAKDIGLVSPECTKSDATSDPFSFWESRVSRALELVLDTRSSAAPVWKTEEVRSQIEEFTTAFANYAAAAEKTADTWTNFFGKADRPEDKTKVKPYVLRKLKARICDPALAEVIRAKESRDASDLAQKNLEDLRKIVAQKNVALAVFTEAELRCN